MNKLIGLIIIAAALVGAALGWQGVSLPFFGELFGGENRTANQIIESVPDTATDQGATQQAEAGNQPTQPTAQAPATIGQAQTNQGTAQAPQTTVGQSDTGAGAATEDSEPITALW
ncbi:MAG: hypothetical protein RIG63_19175 [Coleofasciculus chthonoplastes F3-SA18-01]|uniref:hypothetical protein n=1 Tax=Coleofasciculus chthonoplastes TaxID=64178 RepID=UPI0032FE315A